jgi:predicted dehydrogenase
MIDMEKLRMGYVGCGFMAQKVHIPNILSIPECELLSIAEIRPELGKRVQARYHIPRLYQSHLELAKDKDIQAVAVSGHFAGQGELAIDLLKAGKDVFLEKPMAVSIVQAERILDAEHQNGRRLMIGYMKRYDGGNLQVKNLLTQFQQTGELGSIRFVRNHGFCGNWTAGLDTPFEQTDEPMPPPAGQSVFPSWMPERFHKSYVSYLQQYTHNINLVRWFLNAEDAVKVKAVDLDELDGTSGVVILEIAGVRVVLESGNSTYHGWDEQTYIYLEHGWIATSAPPLLLRNVPATVELYRSDNGTSRSDLFPSSGWTWSYKEEMKHFITSLLNGTPFRSPASDAFADVCVFEDIYRQFIEKQG